MTNAHELAELLEDGNRRYCGLFIDPTFERYVDQAAALLRELARRVEELEADVNTEMEENHAIVGRLLDLDEKRQKAIDHLRARIAELEGNQ